MRARKFQGLFQKKRTQASPRDRKDKRQRALGTSENYSLTGMWYTFRGYRTTRCKALQRVYVVDGALS